MLGTFSRTYNYGVLCRLIPTFRISSWLWLALAILLGFVYAYAAEAQTPEDDRAALEALYYATDGDNWTNNAGWLINKELNDWHGVTTNENGRVTKLELGGNGLAGTLPSELGNLTALKTLYLGNNRLSGAFPETVTKLVALDYLSAGRNEFTSLPNDLSGMTNLRILSFEGNKLADEIPTGLGSLGRLTNLNLSINRLTGSIPDDLGDSRTLKQLLLNNNRLSGPIPANLGNATSLSDVRLDNNRLTGEIPSELGNLTNLQLLYLDNNWLTGEIPSELGNLTNLETLWFDETSVNCDPLTYDPPDQDLRDFLDALIETNPAGGFLCSPADPIDPTDPTDPIDPTDGETEQGVCCDGCAIVMEGEMENTPESTVFNLLMTAAVLFSAISWKSRSKGK